MSEANQDSGSSPASPQSGTPDLAFAWTQELVPFGILTTDTDLRITGWNKWLALHSGRPASEVIGRPLFDLFPELTEGHLKERFMRALEGEMSVVSTALHKYLLKFPCQVAGTNAQHMLQTARIVPLTERGRIVGTLSIIEDVTRREIQSTILNRQRELDRLLSSALGTLLQSTDPAKDVARIFPTLIPPLGLDAYFSYLVNPGDRTMRLNAAGGVPPRQREALATLVIHDQDALKVSGDEPPIPGTVQAHTRTLQSLGLRAHCCFPLVIGERVIGLASFGSYQHDTIAAQDLTVLSRIASYVAIALDRAMREQDAVVASREKDDFLAALSHELRTPLNPVLLISSDSADNPDYPPEAREAFRLIEKNALLEARLIDDLLDLTRIKHGKIRLEVQTVDVHALLRDILVMARPDAADRSLTLEEDLQAEPHQIVGDAGRLQQVFWNVLRNAIKFTPPKGRIRVSTRTDPEAKELLVAVEDTGVGIEPHEIEEIFGTFAQGEHAARVHGHRQGGLGLGLAITRNLLELHSGRIEAASPGRNQGSTFTIHLPLMPEVPPGGD